MKRATWMKGLIMGMLLLSGIFGSLFAQDSSSTYPSPDSFVLVDDPEPKAINLDDVRKAIMDYMSRSEPNEDGKIIVRVLFDVQGNYVKHSVLKSTNPIFLHAVETELPCLRIVPVQVRGKPSVIWLSFPFKYWPEN